MSSFSRNIGRFYFKSILFVLIIIIGSNTKGSTQDARPLLDSPGGLSADSASNTIVQNQGTLKDSKLIRKVPDSAIADFKKNKDFDYANNPEYLQKEPAETGGNLNYFFFSFIMSKWARAFIYVLMATVLCYAFYRTIIVNKLYLFYSTPKKLVPAANTKEDIYHEDFNKKIEVAFDLVNYREAVRYMYLKTLRLLDTKEIIDLNAHGTNHAYESQLQTTKYGKDFSYLTEVYEYIWFGGFIPTRIQAENVKTRFTSFYLFLEH